MGYHVDPLKEAESEDTFAFHYRALATAARWRIVRWWYERKATQHMQSADIWRGLEWRRAKAMGEA